MTERLPDCKPELCEVLVLLWEERGGAGGGAHQRRPRPSCWPEVGHIIKPESQINCKWAKVSKIGQFPDSFEDFAQMQPVQSFGDLLYLVPCRGRGRSGLPTPQAWHLHSELDKVEDGYCGGDLPGPGCGGGMIIINNGWFISKIKTWMWWRRRRTARRSRPVASSWGSCCLALSLWDGGGQVDIGCGSVFTIHDTKYKENFYSYLGLLVHAQLCWTIFRQPASFVSLENHENRLRWSPFTWHPLRPFKAIFLHHW